MNLMKRFSRFFKSVSTQSLTKRQKSSKVVVITGCDSGLGYSLSVKCNLMGLTVVSGCLDLNSEGAQKLANRCYVYDLNVKNSKSVAAFCEKVQNLTSSDKYELHAVVNNAGIMIFGEYEWYTEQQILQQVEVNFIGCLRIAKAFLPLLRKHKGRLINITSHCALSNLPTLTVYGAAKAAVQSWTDGLRSEQKKYGVKVISFIPGSFASQSNIMSSQNYYSDEMNKAFSEEDKKYYGEYFQEFNAYLRHVAGEKKPLRPIEDNKLYQKFLHALLNENPKPRYKHEPWRYFFYYNAFRISPWWLRDFFIQNFMKFPQFKQKN